MCPLPVDSFVNQQVTSADLDADFSMHFVHVFLICSCRYIFAQGGVIISVFGTIIFSDVKPQLQFFLYALQTVSLLLYNRFEENKA